MQQTNPAGFVTDEDGDSAKINNLLQSIGSRLVQFAQKDYIRPHTFLSVGGTKLFRDDIWGRFRFPFRADHLAYKKLGVYNFPQKKYKKSTQNRIMLLLLKLASFRKEVNKTMKLAKCSQFICTTYRAKRRSEMSRLNCDLWL